MVVPAPICVYASFDDGTVIVELTELESSEGLVEAMARVYREEGWGELGDTPKVTGFVIDPSVATKLAEIEWPESPHDDFDPKWMEMVHVCKLRVYKAFEIGG